MSGNSIGKALVLTTFGESHGVAVGGMLDGLPSNLEIDLSFIQSELNRRRPGIDFFSSSRKEDDTIEILSGLYDGKTTGAPVGFLVYNRNQNSSDYDHLKDVYRPSHADFTYHRKYGIRDPRGGGRSSARETLARVAGGAFAKLLLLTKNIRINAWISQIGPFEIPDPSSHEQYEIAAHNKKTISDPVIMAFLEKLKSDGDTAGGVISCSITGVPAGIGEPVFDKLHADLAKAMLSISSAKGFDYGSGFKGASMKGSEHNDRFIKQGDRITTMTNHSGGIQGGISNGEEIYFRVAFKPVSTLMLQQETVNTAGETVIIEGRGRHDVCVLNRSLVILEAMAALVIGDHLIRSNR